MNIYAKEGDEVIYMFPNNGYEGEQEFAKKYLELGKVYTVNYTVVGGSHSSVVLKEVPDASFNTVFFADAYPIGRG